MVNPSKATIMARATDNGTLELDWDKLLAIVITQVPPTGLVTLKKKHSV